MLDTQGVGYRRCWIMQVTGCEMVDNILDIDIALCRDPSTHHLDG